MIASRTLFAALTAAAAFATTPAFAEEAPRTLEVHYGDLNLASAGGAETLKVRVARAAKAVCSADGDKSLKAVAAASDCRQQAMAKATPQVQLALANAATRMADNARVTVAAH